MIREVLLVDCVDDGVIARVADIAGCVYLSCDGSRTDALAAGAAQSRGPWLLFLHAGLVLDPGWIDETVQFVRSVGAAGQPRAGVFRHARSPYATPGWRDAVGWVARLVRPPTGQGLLIARDHYEQLGGYGNAGRHTETRLLRKFARSSLVRLRTRVVVA